MIPAGKVVTGFHIEFEDAHVWRRNRAKMLRIHADPRSGLPSELMARVKPKIEQALGVDLEQKFGRTVAADDWDASTVPVANNDVLPLKGMPGYSMAWGGEMEDSARAGGSLAGSIPTFFDLMILIVIILFNSIKKTAIIWLCVSLALIGVTAGLLLFDQPFGFMALLGLMRAETVDQPVSWLNVIVEQKLGAELVKPFLDRTVAVRSEGWERVLHKYLQQESAT